MNEKVCKHCGGPNPVENNFCAVCGEPFEDRVPNAKGKGDKFNRKTMFLVALAVTVVVNIGLALLLHYLVPAGNGKSCSHVWNDADCTHPEECLICGEVRGTARNHSWLPADCESPEKCSTCGTVRGVALAHNWTPADCTHAETCTICGAANGAPLGHVWLASTYTAPQTCDICKATSTASLRTQLTDFLRQKLPITTYSTSQKDKVYGYEDAGLTNRSDTYYFLPEKDQLVIMDISEDGTAVQVCYPSISADSGHRTLWFPLEDILCFTQVHISDGSTAEKCTTYRLDQKNATVERYGVMAANSTYKILGTHDSGYIVVLYHITETTINGCAVVEKIALIQP